MIPKQFIFSVFLRSSTIVSALGIFLISSYLYGPEGRGVIALLTSFYLTAGFILSLGLGRTAYQMIGVDPEVAHRTIKSLAKYILTVSAGGLCLLTITYLTVSPELRISLHVQEFIWAYGVFPFYLWQNMSNFLYSAQRRTKVHDKVIFVSRTFQLLALILTGSLGASLKNFILAFGLSSALIFIFELLVLTNGNKLTSKHTSGNFRALLKNCRWPMLDNLALAAPPLALFLLGLQIPRDVFGNFSFALQIMATLYFPFTVMQIKLQERINATALERSIPYIKKACFYVAPASIALALSSSLISYILPIVGLTSFRDSVGFMNLLLLTLPLAGITAISQAVLTGLHQPKTSSLTNLAAGIVSLTLIVALTTHLGALAGIISIYSSYLVATILQSIALAKIWSARLK